MDGGRLKIVSLAPFRPNRAATHAGGAFYGRYVHLLAQVADVTSVVMTGEPLAALDISPDVRLLEIPAPPDPRLSRLPLQTAAREAFVGLRIPPHHQRAWLENPEVRALLLSADIVEVQWGQLLPLVPALRGLIGPTPIVVFLHDVMSQSIARLRAADIKARRPRAAARRTLVLPAVRQSEKRLLRLADAFSVPSKKDVDTVKALGIQLPHVIFQLAPDVTPMTSRASEHSTILISGAMFRRENSEGATRFIREGWPLVRQAVPTAQLRIVGSEPEAQLMAYNGHNGVEVVGWVDDLDREYLHARMLVAPLWQGAGVKKKILDALARGCPVVGTSVAAEGLETTTGGSAPVLIGEDPAALALHIIRLLGDDEECEKLGRESWQWACTLTSLDDTIIETLGLYRQLSVSTARIDMPPDIRPTAFHDSASRQAGTDSFP